MSHPNEPIGLALGQPTRRNKENNINLGSFQSQITRKNQI